MATMWCKVVLGALPLGCSLSCSGLVPQMVASTSEPGPGQVLSGGASAGVFEAVAWGFAVVLGALALAFVAKLLNGRGRTVRDGVGGTS